MKLDIGCGLTPLDGYTPIDVKAGKKAYPLEQPDNSVDEIRASHVLEHFSFRETVDVLKEWARVLKPGGLIRVAVPDFDWVVNQYTGSNETQSPLEMYIMGGHEDEHDSHHAIFNRQKLINQMQAAGFGGFSEWSTTAGDTSTLDCSLNIQGVKGGPQGVFTRPFSVAAVMSVPRLGFMDNFFAVFAALLPLKIQLHKYTGAFWGQCLERSMEMLLDKGHDALLTIDYDSVFGPNDVKQLMDVMAGNTDVDAVCSMQMFRGKNNSPLFMKYEKDGSPVKQIEIAKLQREPLLDIDTGHFGLTLLRTSKLKEMPHPWFKGEPNVHGTWGEGRVDDDIFFWKKWQKLGNTLYQANRIPIGHAELMLMWPAYSEEKGFYTIYQSTSEYWEKGKPEGVWK